MHCYGCKKIKAEENFYVTRITRDIFCKTIIREFGQCENCNFFFRSNTCKKIHVRKGCKRRSVCAACQRIYYKSKVHKCETRGYCHICYKYYDSEKEHYCPLELQREPKSLPSPMAFWDIESIVNDTADNCEDCLKTEQAYLNAHKKLRSQLKKCEKQLIFCAAHKDRENKSVYHKCNFIAVLFENDYYGFFDLIVFSDYEMFHENDMRLQKKCIRSAS